ncbi:MAG: ABC transporter transmembrane domain-containing protein, partial [Pseudomonadota bacterium]|nr:ABC transporter transmembrane domain-containing protein [Pseudomonadota bacterium]
MSEEIKKPMAEHWFWGSLISNKGTYVQIALATIFINIFGLGSAFYIMTVYDRVMPNSAYNTLIALTIGMAVVIVFDFVVKLLRAYFVDMAGNNLEKTINSSLFSKITSHDSEFLSKTSGVAHVVREFEGVRDFFTSASMVAFIDLPFMFLFLFVIYSIAGPLAIVPILIVPLVLGVSAIIQPILKKYSDKNLQNQQSKMIVLHELLNNVESVRTIAGGGFLHNKWNDSVEKQSIEATN